MVFINGKECLAISLVHIEGKTLMKHDPTTQRLSTTITELKRDDILNVITGDVTSDPILKKVSEFIDIERNMLKSAYAYAALKDVCKTFGLDEILDSDSIKIFHNKCHTEEICLGQKGAKNMHFFAVSIEPSRSRLDELEQEFVLLDRSKIITKPSATPQQSQMEYYFMGMKIEKLSGVAALLFWEISFI